jgi:hypothetical protein
MARKLESPLVAMSSVLHVPPFGFGMMRPAQFAATPLLHLQLSFLSMTMIPAFSHHRTVSTLNYLILTLILGMFAVVVSKNTEKMERNRRFIT